MDKQIHSFFYTLLFVLTIPLLSGCDPVTISLMTTAASYGTTAYMISPGGEKVRLSNPDGGALDPAAFQAVKSVVTNDLVAIEYLKENRDSLFPVVKQTKDFPQTDAGKAENARNNGVDAFVDVSRNGVGYERNFMSSTAKYGSISVRVITANKRIVYDQTASLVQKATSVDSSKASADYVIKVLGPVLLEDMQKARTSQVAKTNGPATKEGPETTGSGNSITDLIHKASGAAKGAWEGAKGAW